MALPSLFRRKDKPAAPAPAANRAAQPVEAVRLRARRRLIGAVVLLGIGIVAFPLLFETAPRPIPVDLPIEIPRKDAVPPLAAPAQRPPAPASAAVAEPAPAPRPAETIAEKPADKSVEKTAEKAAEKAPEKPPVAEDGARAKALLEGKAAPPVAPGNDRWVVQIGAFAEDRTVRDVRAKAGKLGLQTFTQVVAVEAGERTRVRVGPFGAREEADAAAAKLKQGGLPASVLKL